MFCLGRMNKTLGRVLWDPSGLRTQFLYADDALLWDEPGPGGSSTPPDSRTFSRDRSLRRVEDPVDPRPAAIDHFSQSVKFCLRRAKQAEPRRWVEGLKL